MRLGFACSWGADEQRAWSGTPYHLRAALREKCDVTDLGIHLARPVQRALRAAFAHRHEGTWVSTFDHSAAWASACAAVLPRRAVRARCDAVLQIGDLTTFEQPFLCYQDLSVDVVLRNYEEGHGTPHFPGLSRDFLRRRRDRQLRVYEKAAAVLAMSRFLADDLVRHTGLSPNKVFVVEPGAPALSERTPLAKPRERPRTRLLFVGRDFHTKGGDLVVAALAQLRREHDAAIRLTVAGPPTWPLPGPIPDGVRYLGPLPVGEVALLYDEHDLLVMPSRLEGFGMVFVEALARGLPCIGRAAFAMPELIRDGENGALVGSDDPIALAAVIDRALADDAMYERCWRDKESVAAHFTWSRAARDVVSVAEAVCEH